MTQAADARPTVLIVDDDPAVRYTLREILESADCAVAEAESGGAALSWLAGSRADLLITDLRMPEVDGFALLEGLREVPDAPPTVVITAHGSERHAVRAMKLGASDYFSKPFDIDDILRVVERTVRTSRRERENEQLKAELALARQMVFASDAMKRVALLAHRVAPRDVTVLLSGPSGAGKERVAEAIVAASPRRERPFVRFNCAAIPRELAETELFGHARGAFTGAAAARPGLFREAEGGTLLLDEVGELDLAVQGKLLRALQERRVRPVGEAHEIAVDVRVIAATNRDLAAEVAGRRFREDLYYRLNVVEIRVPPLAERPEDVPLLIDHFVGVFGERYGLPRVTLSPYMRQLLIAAEYPGNVRQLRHRIERLVCLSEDGRIEDEPAEASSPPPVEDATPGSGGLRERVQAFERSLITEELARCGGNRSEAARRLRIGRVTLLEKLRKLGIT